MRDYISEIWNDVEFDSWNGAMEVDLVFSQKFILSPACSLFRDIQVNLIRRVDEDLGPF